ncbi:PIN domain-containing protein [Chitinophaga sp. CC14]|uniref:PIN domain-containing protein n=1 Tax=Chitinophaga sp. CC14 TaxID=3029199 RepID=UPI003B815C8A
MKSSVDKIVNDLEKIKTKINSFLTDYSSIYRSNEAGSMFIDFEGDYSFRPLVDGGQYVQDKLFKQANRIFEGIEVLLMESPEHHKTEFLRAKNYVMSVIIQQRSTWKKDIAEVIELTNEQLSHISTMLTSIFKTTSNVILIPDTNALYAHTSIEQWDFSDFTKFKIIITPSVLKDLDRHKIEHRNEEVRKKAVKLINQIKEFRRRGSLIDGVQVKKDKIELATIAKEPDFTKSFSWLDSSNEDDRLIAETVEIIRDNAGSVIALITADINLQNKCEMADLHFIEPPIPS